MSDTPTPPSSETAPESPESKETPPTAEAKTATADAKTASADESAKSPPAAASETPAKQADAAAKPTDAPARQTEASARQAEASAAQPVVYKERLQKKDAQGRSYGTGRRKNAVARVWLKAGSGKIRVNGRDETVYFGRPVLRMILRQPLAAANRQTELDIECSVRGGGLSGQAGAVRHGLARALVAFDPPLAKTLKPGRFLTRDSRAVERKKYGRRKARRSFQFSKR